MIRKIQQISSPLIALLAFSSFAARGETAFPDIIRSTMDRSKSQEAQFQASLAAIDTKTIATNEERAVILFARGLRAMQSNPGAAPELFDAAKKLLPPQSPLSALTSIYYGRAALSSQNARAILARLKAIGKNNGVALWRPEQFSLMIEIMMILKEDQLLAKTWAEMEARVRPALRDEALAKKVATYLDRRELKNSLPLLSVVESMASSYPHSETGRWAFQKLQQLQCGSDAKHRYVYSQSLVSRLAANTNLDEGLKLFLIELTKGPLRTLSGDVRTMDVTERITYLFQIRFWNEARRLVEEQVEQYSGSQSEAGRVKLARAMSQLGQIQIKQNEYEAAAKTWSRYIALFSDQADSRGATENLADSLARLRIHGAAAKLYEDLARSPSADPILRWQHFWNTYLSGNMTQALALLDRAGYVPQRDRGMEGSLDYWRARILEKQKLTAESDEIYRKILNESADSFYALLVQARRPTLFEPPKGDNFSLRNTAFDLKLDGANAQAKPGHSQAVHSLDPVEGLPENGAVNGHAQAGVNTASELLVIQSLRKWGNAAIGRRLLRLLPPGDKQNGQISWIESFRLATDLKDFAFGFKAPSVPESPLKTIPNAVLDLETHMGQHNADWKLLYPYAYREFVEPLSSGAGTDPFLILSLMRAESVYDASARSAVGARGLMQIMPFTAVRIARMMDDAKFTLEELHQPEVNIGYAAFYVKRLTEYYKGNLMMAVAAYNGGPLSVDRWLSHYGDLEQDEFIETIPFRETRRYVKSVFRNFNNYKTIWQQSKAFAALPKVPDGTSGGEIF